MPKLVLSLALTLVLAGCEARDRGLAGPAAEGAAAGAPAPSASPAPASSPAPTAPTGPPPAPTGATVRASFVADVPGDAGEEAYVCYAFDAAGLDGKLVGSIAWTPPPGPVTLHHASLFAARDPIEVGPVSCDPMPERVAAFGLYTPGSEPLAFPAGAAVRLPAGTTRLVVLAHALRTAPGPAGPTIVDLGLVDAAEHALNWVDVLAPVPTIYPHKTVTSVGVCRFDEPVHLVSTWPHMHQTGSAFLGMVVRADGHAETLIDIPQWDYQHQPIVRVDVDLAPGDAIETVCTWQNPTDSPVVPGPFVANEMCNQGLFVWPFNHARCAAP